MKKVMITNMKLAKSKKAYKQAILNSTADIIIFREKWATDLQAEQLICDLRQIIDGNTTLVINHHHELALELGITNLHFSFEDYKLKEKWIIKLREKEIKCGVSIHSLNQLSQIDNSLVDYLLVGTIFATDCKPNAKTQGIEGLKVIINETDLPIIAIGGITETNIDLIEELAVMGAAQMSSYY